MKYALINGILLDGTETMQPRPGLSILVNGDRIEAIVPAGTEGSDYERIDLAGGYVMPGLINLHVHLPASGRPTVKQKDTRRIVRLMTSNALLRAITFRVCAGYAKTELLSGVTTLRSVGGIQAWTPACGIRSSPARLWAPGFWRVTWRCPCPGDTWPGPWPTKLPLRRRRRLWCEKSQRISPILLS